ncbi:MAG: methyltransferase domain-containing protein [Myxococcota bacterium]
MQELEAGGLTGVTVLRRGRNARTGAREAQVTILVARRPPVSARPTLSPPAMVSEELVRRAVQREMAKVALFPGRGPGWPAGGPHAVAAGYDADEVDRIPAAARESFCGVANVVARAALQRGETVVDVGCGSGLDLVLAASRVGEQGRVWGVEMTEEMLKRASSALRHAGLTWARVHKGVAEELPLPAGEADVAWSNGVLGAHVVDKLRALREMARVLKPGGRLLLAELVRPTVAEQARRAVPGHWASDVVGAIPLSELVELCRRAGFAVVRQHDVTNVLAGSRLEDKARAASLHGVIIEARREGGP